MEILYLSWLKCLMCCHNFFIGKYFIACETALMGNCSNMYPSYLLIHFLLAICGFNQLRYAELFLGFQCAHHVRLSYSCEHLNLPVGVFTFLKFVEL